MDVSCYMCGKSYYCEMYEEQGLCDYCKTNEAVEAKAGWKIVDKKGVEWIRMEDCIDKHLEGYYFNPKTGEYYHASRIIY